VQGFDPKRLVAVQVAGELIEITDPTHEDSMFSATVANGKYRILLNAAKIEFFLFELEVAPTVKDN
jgi:hypothetical protein